LKVLCIYFYYQYKIADQILEYIQRTLRLEWKWSLEDYSHYAEQTIE